MTPLVNLEAYQTRIGVDGILLPDLQTLRRIVEGHACSIPFENLSVMADLPVDLEPESIQRKLITERRGGYCFEQNGLLLLVLQKIGFLVKPLSGRVRVDRTRDFTPPRTHLFVEVQFEGQRWIADVGVGGFSLTAPILANTEDSQETPHETRRIIFQDGRYFHQVQVKSEWVDVYEFTGEEMPPVDREVANWWTSTHPKSKFKNGIMVARAEPDGTRHAVLNRRYVHRRGEEIVESQELDGASQLHTLLRERFRLEPELDVVQYAWSRLESLSLEVDQQP
jgi:N-hydroxyarylamine O-acetyltransferase